MIQIRYSKNKFFVEDQSSIDILRKGSFGNLAAHVLVLHPEEVLYLMDVRNAECVSAGAPISFNGIASRFWKSKKFTARYFTYKDWRDRGLMIKRPFKFRCEESAPSKEYPRSSIKLPKLKMNGTFFKSDLITVVSEREAGKKIYEDLWFGQYGSYKAPDRGQLNKLDIYETIFLVSDGILHLGNITLEDLIKVATSRRRDFGRLYSVYKDWREKDYVIKTGFKFGTHFRVYFPGATPTKRNNASWVHSKHVIHVFPKESKMLISEWARAIRVAHSVRKTFILAVPGKPSRHDVEIDYVLYHRKGGEAESPENSKPRYAMLSFSEDEHIGGSEFAAAVNSARKMKLEPIIAIADRETSVTYYKIRQIKLAGSDNDYYEIDWFQP
jgi:tRNA-intron endonuclease